MPRTEASPLPEEGFGHAWALDERLSNYKMGSTSHGAAFQGWLRVLARGGDAVPSREHTGQWSPFQVLLESIVPCTA